MSQRGLRRPDASMTLLVEAMQRPLDPAYAAAARRRRDAGLAPSTGVRSPLLVIAAVVLGFLLVVAALALRPAGTSGSRAKEQLVGQIHSRQAHGDAQVETINRLRAEIRRYQDPALTNPGQSGAAAELARLEPLSGAIAVTGPGLTITIDDAPSPARGDTSVDPRRSPGFSEGRVSARDLQILTNGLWQAGAEAVSVGGQRLTSLSAIRFAGEAILVDYRPLTRPYVLSAIGEPVGLRARFSASSAGSYLTALGDSYRIPSAIKDADQLVLPPSPALRVTLAQPAPTGIPSATSPPHQ